jgi:sodium-independent sulfate anion transporter 11
MSSSNRKSILDSCPQLYTDSKITIIRGKERVKRKFPNYARSLLPFASWVKNYQLRWLVGDVVAGLTVGVMIVPQALAYSKLTGLSSEYALYSSLMGGIVYSFFGTCRESSLGPSAVVCLVLGQSIQDLKARTDFTGPEIASVFCIITALFSILLGVLRLGFLLELVSHPVILGFTTGAAFKIMLSQIPGLLGIPNVNTNQMAHLIIANIFNNLSDINWVNLTFGLSSLVLILTLNFITYKRKRHPIIQYLSIATIGIRVIIFTIAAYLVKLNYPDTKLNLVGNVPSGIKLTLPPSDPVLWSKALPLAIPLTLIMLMELLEIMKIFTKRGGYSANTSQEMVALGIANLVGTFFSAFPITGALSRCAVLSKAGARTPLAGGFTGIVVILAVLVLTPEFKYIPFPTLAAVIVVAVSKLVMKWSELVNLFLIDILDFSLCVLCVLFTFFLGSELGVYISMGLSFFILVLRIAHPKLSVLFKVIGDGDHFEDRKNTQFDSENPEPGVIIFRPRESLLFPNIEHFKEVMMNVVLEETASLAAIIPAKDKPWSDDLLSKGEHLRVLRSRKTRQPKVNYSDLPPLKAIIMDLTSVNRIDGSGIQGLVEFKEMCAAYSGINANIPQIKCCDKESMSIQTEECLGFNLYFVSNDATLIHKLTKSELIRNSVSKPDGNNRESRIKDGLLHSTVGGALKLILG